MPLTTLRLTPSSSTTTHQKRDNEYAPSRPKANLCAVRVYYWFLQSGESANDEEKGCVRGESGWSYTSVRWLHGGCLRRKGGAETGAGQVEDSFGCGSRGSRARKSLCG